MSHSGSVINRRAAMISKLVGITAILLLILSLTACGSSVPTGSDEECLTHEDIELAMVQVERTGGEKVVLTYSLSNKSKEDYHSGRSFKMEYKKDGEWAEVDEYMPYTDDVLTIPPGETVTADGAFLPPPEYGGPFRMTKTVYTVNNRDSFDIQFLFYLFEKQQ